MSIVSTPFVGETADTVLHVVSFVFLIGSILGAAIVFWKLHEMPVHKAKQKNKHHQIELVTVLTWIGFFVHWVWIVAVFIAFVDIEKLIKGFREIWENSDPHLDENKENHVTEKVEGDKLC